MSPIWLMFSGLQFLAYEALALFDQVDDFIRFDIFGAEELPAVLRNALTQEQAYMRGYLPDIGEALRQYAVHLVPTPIPLGARSRIIESFQYGCPVVAHASNGVGLVDMVDRENCWMFTDGPGLVEGVTTVIDDKALARRIGEAGRATYEEHYTLETAGKELLELVERTYRGGGN